MTTTEEKPQFYLKKMRCPGSIEPRLAVQIRVQHPQALFPQFVCCLGLLREGPGRKEQYQAARALILALDKAED